MRKRWTMLAGLLLTLATAQVQSSPENGGSIRVQVNYTGKGTVNQGHKIFVALWNSPDFAQPNPNVTPVAVKWVASKTGIVTFSDVKKTPAYVSCAYDPAGTWDGHSTPPDDASVGMYGNAAMQPQPVTVAAGRSTKVEIAFDDSVKWK